MAHLLTGTNLAAEDIAQEAFAKLHQRFDDVDHPERYLRIAVINTSRDWHRRTDRERIELERVRPLTVTEGSEQASILEFVDRLPYRMRAVVVLRYWEIAATLGCPLMADRFLDQPICGAPRGS